MNDLEILESEKQMSIKFDGMTMCKARNIFKGMTGSTRYQGNYTNFDFKPIEKKEITVKPPKVKTQPVSKYHSINKSKLKAKIHSFFRLKQSEKFCAFYSISFPQNFPDKSAQIVLNNVLTSLRLNALPFQYIWVAERQKNGTIHFHMLMNRWLNIRITNLLFARAISHEMNVSKLHHINFNPSIYNGVDVERVMSEKGINNYITKYVSKNNEKFKGRAWASCQIVSRMFTSISYMFGEVYMNDAHFYYNAAGDLILFEHDFFINWPLKHPPPRYYMKPLIDANEQIANGMKKKRKPISKMTDQELKKFTEATKVKHVQLSFDFAYLGPELKEADKHYE